MDDRKRAAIEFSLSWKSRYAVHNDRLFIDKVDFWRDIFPGFLGDMLARSTRTEEHTETFGPGSLVPPHSEKNIITFNKSQLSSASTPGHTAFKPGRFYPKGLFWQALESFPADQTPVRLIQMDDNSITVDTNHPLSRYSLTVTAKVRQISSIAAQRGGSLHDIGEEITADGPGMQAVDSLEDDKGDPHSPLTRDDESDDSAYYRTPRLVHHLDERARAQVRSFYERMLKPGSTILDLMGSWESHLPESLGSSRVEGLGMNGEELKANRRLSGYLVHDLNNSPVTPFSQSSFDAVVCTVSFEYLCRPSEVLADLARIMKPGALLAITVSERWFPGKQVHGWADLHPFERQALISNYLLSLGCFENLETESIRGYPRPAADKYADRLSTSDPLYFIRAQRR